MNIGKLLWAPLGAALVTGPVTASFAAPDDQAVLRAITDRAASVNDYHYRAQLTMPGDVAAYTAEVWYQGPDRVRSVMSFGHDNILAEAVIAPDAVYNISHFQYQVMKSEPSERGDLGLGGGREGLVFPYLTAELLKQWPQAELHGSEEVGGRACRVIDLDDSAARLGAELIERDDFVALIPTLDEPSGYRLWVDPETGMIWRWARFSRGQARTMSEVVETQRVNGIEFPSVVRAGYGFFTSTQRITEADVNSGVDTELVEPRLPPNWLVMDNGLTEQQVREHLEDDPDSANLHYTLGQLQFRNGRREEAAKELRRAAELAPQSPTPLVSLAQVLQSGRNEDPDGAIDALRQAIELAGDVSWYLHMSLAQALARAGRTDEAIAEYRQIAQAGPPLSYAVSSELADALAKKGDFEGAYSALADVPADMLFTFASQSGAIVEWAQKAGRLDELEAKLREALAKDPAPMGVQLLLISVLGAQGRRQEAVDMLKAIEVSDLTDQSMMARRIISLAEELGDPETTTRVRRAVIRMALESGSTWLLYPPWGVRGPDQEAWRDLITEGATLWTEAEGAPARAALLRSMAEAADRSAGRGDDPPSLEIEQLTPAECAVAAVIASERADRGRGDESREEWRNQAAACFERALAQWPDDAALWARVGRLRWSSDDWPGAAEAYRRAAEADPNEIEYPARVAFALVHRRTDDVFEKADCEPALEIARKAIEPWPEEWAAKAFLATLQMNCDQLEPARDALVGVYESPDLGAGDKTDVGRILARCHERLGEMGEAEAVLKQGIAESEDRNRRDAYSRLIHFYAGHGRIADVYATAKAYYFNATEDWMKRDAARSAFDRSFDEQDVLTAARADLEANPGDPRSLEFAAAVFEQRGRLQEALPLLSEAAAKANDADVWIRLADLSQRAENGQLAAEALKHAVELRPDDADLRSRYARAAAAQGDTAAAKVLADELQGAAGDSADAWREVAGLYLTAEAWDDALAAAERLLALTPEADDTPHMRAQILAARAYAGMRDDHEARRRLIPILARAKDTALLREAADALVDLYLLRDERDQAIATLNDLRRRTDDDGLHRWIDQRLAEVVSEEPPPDVRARGGQVVFD